MKLELNERRGFKERNLKSELQSFEPLRCFVCNVSIKLSRADFLECWKCSQFVSLVAFCFQTMLCTKNVSDIKYLECYSGNNCSRYNFLVNKILPQTLKDFKGPLDHSRSSKKVRSFFWKWFSDYLLSSILILIFNYDF